ncbi:hypothetical protein EJ110_NYTH00344 [Nymphaea thermarum]|nr:hypothetical protein EJ110_NYTH00344 [Nymphaea thermarum]
MRCSTSTVKFRWTPTERVGLLCPTAVSPSPLCRREVPVDTVDPTLLVAVKYRRPSTAGVPVMFRQYLLEATEEASTAYNKAVWKFRKLEGLQWTIHQVEIDLKRSSDHPAMQLSQKKMSALVQTCIWYLIS